MISSRGSTGAPTGPARADAAASPVHGVGEDQVGLAGLQADLEDLLPERAGVDLADHLVVLGERRPNMAPSRTASMNSSVIEMPWWRFRRLAVEVAGGFADLQELLDLRVVDVEVDRRRAAAQRALADGQRQRVHHPDEGDDAAGLAGALHLLADRADAAPVGADAAAVGGQRHVLVPDALDAFQAVRHGVQEAGDRQAAAAPPFDSTGVDGMNHRFEM
jgi:hypothetical protein